MAIKEIAVKYTADIREAERNVKQLQKITEDLTEQIHDIRIEIKNAEEAKRVVQEIDRFLDALQKRKIELAPDITKLENLRNKIKEIDKEIADLEGKRIGLDSKGIKEINNEINKLRNQKKQIKIEIDGLEKAEKEVKDIEKTVNKLGETRGKIYVDDSQIDEAKENLVEMILKSKEADGKLIEEEMRLNGSKQVLSELERTQALIEKINATTVTIKAVGAGLQTVGDTMLSMVGINSANPLSFFTNMAKFVTKGFGFSALYRLTSKMMNSVEGFVSDAMKRFDTLRNAKYVWEELGYSAEDYDNVIATLQDRLTGLPTKTDEAINGIQKMMAQIGLDKATKTFLALNDGILGFGGSTEQVNRAVTQLSQSLGSGYIDGQTYRALMDGGLAPVMTKLAEKFGYATNEVGEFKNALGGKGDSQGRHITPDEFLDALIELDDTTVENSMYSLAKKATTGFQSAMINMRTAITRGFTNVMMAGVDVMATGEIPNYFSDAISKFGKFFENTLNGVADWIRNNQDTIKEFFKTVSEYVGKFADSLSKFDFGAFFQGLKESMEWIKPGIEFIKGLVDAFKEFVTWLGEGDFSKGLGEFLGDWIRIGATLSVLGRALQLFAKPLATLSVISGGKWSLPNLLGKFFGKGKEMSDVAQNAQSFSTAFDTGGALNKLTNLAFITGLIGDLYLLALTIKKFDESVPEDMGTTAKKVASMAEIVGAMGLLVGAMGWATKNHADIVALGELGLLGLAVDLGALGKAMGEFDRNTPTDFKQTSKKIGNLGEAVTAIAILAGALGGLTVATGGVFGGAELLGMGLILGIAADLGALGKAIGTFDKNMPSNTEGLKEKIESVNEVISAIGGTTFSQMMTSGFKAGTVDNVKNAMKAMVEIAKSVSKLMEIEIPNVADVTKRIELIDSVVGKLSHGTIMEQWGASINKDTVNEVKIAMNSYIEIAKALNELITLIPKGTDTTAFEESMEAINEVVSTLKSGHGNAGWLQEKGTSMKWSEVKKQVKEASQVVSTYLEIAQTLTGFSGIEINPRTFENLFGNIKIAMDKLTEIMGTDGGTRQKIIDLVSYVSAMNDVVKQLDKAIKSLSKVQGSEFNYDTFAPKIDQIKQAMDKLIDLDPNTGVVNATEKMAQVVQAVSDAILDLQTMTNSFTSVGESYADSLYNGFADMNVGHLMEAEISSAIQTLQGKKADFKALGKSYQDALLDGFGGGFSVGMAAKMAMFATTLTSYTGAFRSAGVTLGQAFADGINSATANISVRITGSGVSSSGTSLGGRIGGALGRQYGGVIYRANGGETVRFIPRGTDTVPAMLTPGEYVVRREAVQKIGLPLLEKLNNMDIQGMFNMFMNNFAMGRKGLGNNTVINNVTNNDNRRIDISGDRTSRRGQYTRASRFMKAMAV